MPISREIKEYVAERFDQLFSELNTKKTLKKIREELEKKFDKEILDKRIYDIALEQLIHGTHLHNFFDLMTSDFKAKYGKNINQENPVRLLKKVSDFIEYEYGFGGTLNKHERYVLSKFFSDKREDIIFIKGSKVSSKSGKTKGKLGYFKQ